MFASDEYNNIVSIKERLICTNEFRAVLFYLIRPNGVLRHFLISKYSYRETVRKILVYPHSAIRFIQTHFISLASFMEIPGPIIM